MVKRREGRLLLPILAVAPLAGCLDFTDPPPDPSTAPLEIVANDQARAACSLNRAEVTVGVHRVVVVTEGVDAVVVLRDGAGAVLLEQRGDTFPQPSPGEKPADVLTPSVPVPDLRLASGTYQVRCRYPNGAAGTTRLHVTP